MLVVIRGAGDIATGVALRLWRAGIQVAMTDLEKPTAIRRTVAFSQAIVHGEAVVEGVTARRAESPDQALELLAQTSPTRRWSLAWVPASRRERTATP